MTIFVASNKRMTTRKSIYKHNVSFTIKQHDISYNNNLHIEENKNWTISSLYMVSFMRFPNYATKPLFIRSSNQSIAQLSLAHLHCRKYSIYKRNKKTSTVTKVEFVGSTRARSLQLQWLKVQDGQIHQQICMVPPDQLVEDPIEDIEGEGPPRGAQFVFLFIPFIYQKK